MKKHHEHGTMTRRDTVTAPTFSTRLRVPGTHFENSFLSTISDMERAIEDSFRRPIFGWNPLSLGHLFDMGGSHGDFIPAVDVVEDAAEVIVKAELPGMKREDIDITMVDGTLVISGEKKNEERVERRDYLRLERIHGAFRRTISMPDGIDDTHVSASFRDGILEVHVPKSETSDKARHIEIE